MHKKLLAMSGLAALLVVAALPAAATDLETAMKYCGYSNRDPMQAIDNCTKVIESSGPKDLALALTRRGTAYLTHGWLDMALADYDRALKLEPNKAARYHNRALALRQLGRYDQALADHDRAISMDKGNEKYQRQREITLQRMGRGS